MRFVVNSKEHAGREEGVTGRDETLNALDFFQLNLIGLAIGGEVLPSPGNTSAKYPLAEVPQRGTPRKHRQYQNDGGHESRQTHIEAFGVEERR